MSPADGDYPWGRTALFAACVFLGPTLVAVVAVGLLAADGSLVSAAALLAGSVALAGAILLTLLLRRVRPLDIPVLVLNANAAGFAGAALVGLVLPIATGGPPAVSFGFLGLFVAMVGFLLVGGPLWVGASAMIAARLVLPPELARANGRRAGLVLGAAGSLIALGTIAAVWVLSHRDGLDARCVGVDGAPPDQAYLDAGAIPGTVTPEGLFSWFPLGVHCEWRIGAALSATGPDWFPTIVVVCALALAAFGAALSVRGRTPRQTAPRVPDERWDAAEDPWR